MFINLDYNKRPKEAKLHLAKPNKRTIANIYEKFNEKLSVKLGNINELNFSIPQFITNDNQNVIHNQLVDLIKEKMLIRVDLNTYKEWYIVDSIEEDVDNTDTFNVTAFSLPYELKGKRISGLEEESINATELLTMLLEPSVWKIGTIDPIFDTMFRSFESGDDGNVLDCIMQAGETFGALIEWDTIGRKVSFKDATKNGKFKGMTVSYGRFLRSLKRTRTTDEMVTRLYVYGNEELDIMSVNPTGQRYIEDFSFFMYPFQRDQNNHVITSSHFMSDELCHAILDQKRLIEQYAPQIKELTDSLATKQISLITEQSKMDGLELDLKNILELLDVAKASEDESAIASGNANRDAKESEIQAQQIVLDSIDNQITIVNGQLESLQNVISNQSNFTPQLLDELNLYVIESTWRDDRYINASELYEDALKKFNEIRQPKVVIEASIDNLLNIVEEQYYWDKLNLGDLIKVRYKEMNIEYMAKIMEIEYDFENGEANLTIANTTDLLDETEKLVQLLYGSSNASSVVQNNKYKWNKVNAVSQQVSNLLTDEWDANKQKIIAGVHNSVEVGNRGIIITNPDFPTEVVIMQSGVIALSKDGGETWKTAIKPDGVVAERLIGQIIAGQELIITNQSGSFTFDNNGVRIDANAFVIESSSGSNLIDKWTDSSDFIDSYTDDNIVTAYEKKMLKIEWDKTDKEHDSISTRINATYDDDGASLNFVQVYYTRYVELYDYLFVDPIGDKPLLDESNMIYSTRIDSAIYKSRFENYNTAKIEVLKQLDLKAISISNDAKEIAQGAEDNINEIKNDVVYKTELHSTNGDTFTNGQIDTMLYVVVYRGKENITSTLPNSAFIWKKSDKDGNMDVSWNNAHVGVGNTVHVTSSDVFRKAVFWCDIDIS